MTEGRNALTIDSRGPYSIRLRVEYPAGIERFGSNRIRAVMGDAIKKLEEVARLSDPSSRYFKVPADDGSAA